MNGMETYPATCPALAHFAKMWAEEAVCGEPLFNPDGSGRGASLYVVLKLATWADLAIADAPMCPACVAVVARETGAMQAWEV